MKKIVLFCLYLFCSLVSAQQSAIVIYPSYVIHPLNTLTQQLDNPMFIHHWFERYSISGLMNLEGNYQSRRNFIRGRGTESNISATKLNLDGYPTDWLSGHVGLFYAGNKKYYEQGYQNRTGLKIDEAFLTLADFNKTPFFIRGGEQYLPFGQYYQFPLLTSLPKQLSETKAAAIQTGWIVKNGFYGSMTFFQGQRKDNDASRNNGVLSLNYQNFNHPYGIDLGLDYISNMNDVGTIAHAIKHYQRRINGMAAHASVLTGPFDFDMRYVMALKSFNVQDFTYQKNVGNNVGAEPRAGEIKAGYTFKLKEYASKINIGYQWSKEGYNVINDGLKMPKSRWQLSYSVHLKRPIILSALAARDKDYSRSHGGTGNNNWTALIRMSVLF